MRSAYGERGRCSALTTVVRPGRFAQWGALLALVPLLSGCIALAALPVLAGGAMIAGGNVKIGAATPNPGAPKLVRRKVPERTAGAPAEGIALTTLSALPAPTSLAPDPWAELVSYALAQVPAGAEQPLGRSALLISGSSLELPRRRPCAARDPAVIVDLDRAAETQGATPPQNLGTQLEQLRAAGIVVVWISSRPAAEVAQVAASLRASGLDPAGTDPLLLLRTPSDRKQALREEAALDVCPIAIAGDRKGDFDELFDYLRDPQAATGLDSLLGSGWFIVPPPL